VQPDILGITCCLGCQLSSMVGGWLWDSSVVVFVNYSMETVLQGWADQFLLGMRLNAPAQPVMVTLRPVSLNIGVHALNHIITESALCQEHYNEALVY